MKPRAAFFYDYPLARDGDVFGGGRREKIAALTDLYPHVVHARNFGEHAARLGDVEVILATWGLPAFTDAHFAAMPKLRAIFYAAGNVKAFAAPLVERDVVLVSSWGENAIATAQLVFAQILLTCRGYYRGVRQYAATKDVVRAKDFRRAGAEGETIGLIGMGWIARRLTKMLHEIGLRVVASDPYLTDARARELGVEKVSLEDLFARAYVVSNHVPDLPTTQRLFGAALFERMREGATFINSGRGAQVIEDELARVLGARPDLTALLDVTWPEPPAAESPLWALPNVVISPHVGGTIGDEVGRLADCVIAELESWLAGRPLQHQVTREILATMG
jgi:phosphoglycerate dehydrogenase-like enzyme